MGKTQQIITIVLISLIAGVYLNYNELSAAKTLYENIPPERAAQITQGLVDALSRGNIEEAIVLFAPNDQITTPQTQLKESLNLVIAQGKPKSLALIDILDVTAKERKKSINFLFQLEFENSILHARIEMLTTETSELPQVSAFEAFYPLKKINNPKEIDFFFKLLSLVFV